MKQSASFEDVIDRLRPHTVPSGYTYSTWKPGMFTAYVYVLRSPIDVHVKS